MLLVDILKILFFFKSVGNSGEVNSRFLLTGFGVGGTGVSPIFTNILIFLLSQATGTSKFLVPEHLL